MTKQRTAGWIILLTVPAAALALLGIATASQKRTLTLKSVNVSRLSPSPTAGRVTSREDTQWTVNIRCLKSPWSGPFQGRSIRLQSAYIEDARGMRHVKLAGMPAGLDLTTWYESKLLPGDTYRVRHYGNLASVPQAWGKLTFKAIYEAHDGTRLPVAITLRP